MSNQLFHPVEQAFLSDWLGQDRPEIARAVNLDDWLDANAEECICPKTNETNNDDSGFDSIANAVARLCLNVVQWDLPQWRSESSNGAITWGRQYELVIMRRLQLVPRLVLEVNWATGAPGFTWPEAWYVTALPQFNRCVVTASVDSTDTWGWTDFAIGHFAPGDNLLDNCLRIIAQYWCTHHGYRSEPFESITKTGLATAADAWRAAQSVWSQKELQA